jgi:hypothetical protein
MTGWPIAMRGHLFVMCVDAGQSGLPPWVGAHSSVLQAGLELCKDQLIGVWVT